jgi:hypothetical protein
MGISEKAEAMGRYAYRVYDYAEVEKGYDPIGAGDILGDLMRYAYARYAEMGEAEPEVVYDEFVERGGLEPYFGKP